MKSVLSRCGEYVASCGGNGTLTIHRFTDSVLFRRYNLRKVLNSHYARNAIDHKEIDVLVKQMEWEETVDDSISTKLAVVVNSFVVVFDIRGESEPILVQQPRNEGVEKVQWVPPIDTKSGGYVNSKQFVVYTQHYLQMKVYSVDCTHILFSILKPVLKSIIIRPRRRNCVWSVVADALEYNAPAIVYHFYNEGSTSVLLQRSRLPKIYLSPPTVEWSDSGKWLLIFSDRDSIYGYDLKVYDSLGLSGRSLIDLNYVKDSILDRFNDEDSKLVLRAQNYATRWISVHDTEYMLVASISQGSYLEFSLVSTNLLRIVAQSTFLLGKIANCWKRMGNAKYRVVNQRTFSMKSTAIRHISSINAYSCVQFDEALLIFGMGQESQFSLRATISLELPITVLKPFEYDNDHLLFATSDHVAIYNLHAQELQVIYSGAVRDAFVELTGTKLFVIVAKDLAKTISNWQRIEVHRTEKSQPKKQNDRIKIGLTDTSNIEEFTDTFNNRKRLKR